MKKVLVLYKSKTGFSERYARWIADNLQCDLVELADFNKQSLSEYQLIVYGGGLYSGQINGIGKIKRWMKEFSDKIWVVFATGATPSRKYNEEFFSRPIFAKVRSDQLTFFTLSPASTTKKWELSIDY